MKIPSDQSTVKEFDNVSLRTLKNDDVRGLPMVVSVDGNIVFNGKSIIVYFSCSFQLINFFEFFYRT